MLQQVSGQNQLDNDQVRQERHWDDFLAGSAKIHASCHEYAEQQMPKQQDVEEPLDFGLLVWIVKLWIVRVEIYPVAEDLYER